MLDHAIFWHVYPLGATGAPIRDWSEGDEGHRLPRLIGWLDYLIDLGCNGLLLAPVFASGTHGYDTLDHFRIDPRLGDEADFDLLMAACRERGVEVLLDGVFNHVGARHPMVEGGGPVKRDADGRPVGWEGHGDLVELDHSDPRTADLVVDVFFFSSAATEGAGDLQGPTTGGDVLVGQAIDQAAQGPVGDDRDDEDDQDGDRLLDQPFLGRGIVPPGGDGVDGLFGRLGRLVGGFLG